MRDRFEEPIWFLIGLGYPHSVDSVSAAYSLLLDQPTLNRDVLFRGRNSRVQVSTSRRSRRGEIRGIVERFAKRRGILAPAPQMVGSSILGGNKSAYV